MNNFFFVLKVLKKKKNFIFSTEQGKKPKKTKKKMKKIGFKRQKLMENDGSLLFHISRDVLKDIYSYLTTSELAKLRLTCLFFRTTIVELGFWKQKVPVVRLETYVMKCRSFEWEIPEIIISDVDNSKTPFDWMSGVQKISFVTTTISNEKSIKNIYALVTNRNIPPTLTTLDFRFMDEETDFTETLKVLPTSITSLSIPRNVPIHLLPRNLKCLDASSVFDFSSDSILELPPKLIELKLRSASCLTNYAMQALPISLTSLNLEGSNFKFQTFVKLSRLTTLSLSNCRYFVFGSVNPFPDSLTSLDLSYCSEFTDNHISFLPTRLQHLRLRGCSISEKAIPHLPPALVSLDVEYVNGLTDECISKLRTTLQKIVWSCDITTTTSLLSLALYHEQYGFAVTLIIQNYDVKQGEPLVPAVKKGKFQIVKALVEKGADLNSVAQIKSSLLGYTTHITPLVAAIKEMNSPDQFEIVKYLLEHGAKTNSITDQCVSPLYLAAQRGDHCLVTMLLNHGANVNGYDHFKQAPPLWAAVESDNVDMVQTLLDQGADPNAVSEIGTDVVPIFLSLCSRKESQTEAIMLSFLEKGANVNIRGPSGDTPLHFACSLGFHEELVNLLIAYGAEVNAVNKSGLTPLHLSCRKTDSAVVKILVENGADINAHHLPQNMTPLMLVCKDNFAFRLIPLLLSYGADVTIQRHSKETALFYLVQSGNVRMAIELLQKGADPNIESVFGQTPLSCAYLQKDITMFRMLLRHGAIQRPTDSFVDFIENEEE